jgi:hypothetical protein
MMSPRFELRWPAISGGEAGMRMKLKMEMPVIEKPFELAALAQVIEAVLQAR